jgi:hypothetical protein
MYTCFFKQVMTGLPYFKIYFFTYNGYSVESKMVGMFGGYAEDRIFQQNNILRHNFSKSLHGAVCKKGLTGERGHRE